MIGFFNLVLYLTQSTSRLSQVSAAVHIAISNRTPFSEYIELLIRHITPLIKSVEARKYL